MPRDYGINIYHECDITEWCVSMIELMDWCEQHLEGNWNVVAESGLDSARGSGDHCVIMLFDNAADMCQFKLSWHP